MLLVPPRTPLLKIHQALNHVSCFMVHLLDHVLLLSTKPSPGDPQSPVNQTSPHPGRTQEPAENALGPTTDGAGHLPRTRWWPQEVVVVAHLT